MNRHKNPANASSSLTPPTPHHKIPLNEKTYENLISSLGGITITIEQKVEVKGIFDDKTKRLAPNKGSYSKIPRPTTTTMVQRKDRPVQISPTRTKSAQRSDLIPKINPLSINSRKDFPGLGYKVQSNFTVNAPTANPENSNDPTDMEDEDSSTTAQLAIPPKLLHTALVPLEQYRKYELARKNVDSGPNSHPKQLSHVESKQKMTMPTSQGAKRPSQIFRQRLLEQSVSVSLNSSWSNNSMSLKAEKDNRSEPANTHRPRKLLRANSKRKRTLISSPSVKLESLPEQSTSVPLTGQKLDKSMVVQLAQDVQGNISDVNLRSPQLSSVGSIPNAKRPSQVFRQHLLEQSISMSLTGSGFSNLTSIKPTQDVSKNIPPALTNNRNLRHRRLSRANSRRKVLSSNVKRESQIFRQRLLEQSVSMSLVGSGLKHVTSTELAKDVSKNDISAPINAQRANYKRKGSSISPPDAKRASQIFRQRLLEQSVSMSLSGSGSNSLNQSRLPVRRLSRRARERESRMNNANIDSKCSPVLVKPNAVNILPTSKILESEELSQKVNQEIQRQARLKPPQPPPRNVTHNPPTPSSIPTPSVSKNDSPPLISLLPERKITGSPTQKAITQTSPRPISIDILPFPTHLSHRNTMKIPFPMSLRVAPRF
ncbi:2578_t:CDS:1 [Acaulospora colombiana]|uniref:2578_t:CDS:1 n=1 Tax=Acaulospora colombiana TaxID=27376 RepID=A0ACA9LMJ9_9GLOM|nr:2578_t:CDS:1 [Acaulospora colombiana]